MMNDQFEGENVEEKVPMVKALPKPTPNERERHQLTQTPYAALRPHRVAARVVRHKHPRKGRHTVLAPDVEKMRFGIH